MIPTYCESPRCQKKAKKQGQHNQTRILQSGSTGYYCEKCAQMWIERGVLRPETVQKIIR